MRAARPSASQSKDRTGRTGGGDHLGLQIGPFHLLRQIDINPDHSRVFLAVRGGQRPWHRLTVFDPKVVTESMLPSLRDRLGHAATLDHPNLLPIRSIDVYDGLLTFTNDWPNAWTLRDVLDMYAKRSGQFPEPLLAVIGMQLQDLLRYLAEARSRAGLPLEATSGNLGLDSIGIASDGRVLHLAAPHVSLNEIASLVPPPAHPRVLARLAPEQLKSYRPSARGDVYSLGLLLASMVVGRNPLECPSASATRSAVREGADLGMLTDWEPALATAMRHAITPAAERRDPNLGRIHRALDRARMGHGGELTDGDVAALLHELFGSQGRPTPPLPTEGDDDFIARLRAQPRAAAPPAPLSPPMDETDAHTVPAITAPGNVVSQPPADRSRTPTILAGAALLISILVAGIVIGRLGQTPPAAVLPTTVTTGTAAQVQQTSAADRTIQAAAQEAASDLAEAQAVAEQAAADRAAAERALAESAASGQTDEVAKAEAQARANEARAKEADARARAAEAKARQAEASAKAATATARATTAAAQRAAADAVNKATADAAATQADAAAKAEAAAVQAAAVQADAAAAVAEPAEADAAAAVAEPVEADAAAAVAEPVEADAAAAVADAAGTVTEAATSAEPAAQTPAAPSYDRGVGSALPTSYDARSPQDVLRALSAVESYAMKAGVPASLASGATSSLTAHLVQDYVPGDSLTVKPRAAFNWVITAAQGGKSASAIRSGLLRAHTSGQL